jgi:hypothetical protein
MYVLLGGDEPAVRDALEEVGSVEEVEIGGRELLHVTGTADIADVVVGYDPERLDEIRGNGLDVIARIPEEVATVDPQLVADRLIELGEDYDVDQVLFTGAEAPYNADVPSLRILAYRLRDAGYSPLLVELIEQSGTDRYARIIGRGIRLHSLNLATIDPATAVDRGVRAVKERNVRVILMRPTLTRPVAGQLDEMTTLAAGIRDAMPQAFETGRARPFDELTASPLLLLGALSTGAGVVALGAGVLSPVLAALGAVLFAAAGGLWVATGSQLLGDLLRLGVAIVGAGAAVLVAMPRINPGPAVLEYLKAGAVVVATGLTVTALAYETRYLVGTTDFWGVKALLAAPLLIVGAIVAYRSLGGPTPRDGVRLLRTPIEVWQVAVAAVVAAGVWYLLLRSGNTGAATDAELTLRQGLEDLFYVRPRTKEFLIGFPALIAGILVAARSRHGWWLYAIASVGTASAVDSFTHFHTPLGVSLLRTGYAVTLGLVIGIVAVVILRAATGLVLRQLARSRT